jgi:predicted DNA binding protein
MIDISMDMQQYDCPFIDTTADHDVSFAAFHWAFEEATRELETRMVVEAATRDQLDAGLETLREHPSMFSYELVKRWGDVAHIRTVIDETDAMGTIRTNDGYITGPFFIENGSEIWHVGFDSPGRADATLAELERNNEFDVVSRDENGLPDFQALLTQSEAAMELVEATRSLSSVERETLAAAVDGGYFKTPRETSLGALADEFDVSKSAVSKNIRRGQAKLTARVVDVMDDLEGTHLR